MGGGAPPCGAGLGRACPRAGMRALGLGDQCFRCASSWGLACFCGLRSATRGFVAMLTASAAAAQARAVVAAMPKGARARWA